MSNATYLKLTEEQEMLLDLVKDFCQKEVDQKKIKQLCDIPLRPDSTVEELRARMPWDIIRKSHDVGLRYLTVPEEYGGGGMAAPGHMVTFSLLAEAAGYYGGAEIGIYILSMPWRLLPLLCHAPKELQDEYFPAFMAKKDMQIGYTGSEPDHGGDIFLPYADPEGKAGKTIAKKDGNVWIVNGDKMFSTAGAYSDYVILQCRADTGPFPQAGGLFLVPTNAPGFSVTRVNCMMSDGLMANVQTSYQNYRLPARYMIAGPKQGAAYSDSVLCHKRIYWAVILGAMQKAFEDIRDYAKTRVQGGKPIIQHANVAERVAEADVLVRSLRGLIYTDAMECDNTPANELGVSNEIGEYYLNYWFKDIMYRLAKIGFDVYGGMGVQKDMPFESFVRGVMTLMPGGGSQSFNLIKAAKLL